MVHPALKPPTRFAGLENVSTMSTMFRKIGVRCCFVP